MVHPQRLFVMLAVLAAVTTATARAACPVTTVELVDPADSRTATVGTVVRLRTIATVTSPLIPSGTPGYAVVTYVRHAERGGQSGQVVLDPRVLVVNGGHRVDLAPVTNDAVEASGRRHDAPFVLGFIPYVTYGVSAYGFVHEGGPGVLGVGSRFNVSLGVDENGACPK